MCAKNVTHLVSFGCSCSTSCGLKLAIISAVCHTGASSIPRVLVMIDIHFLVLVFIIASPCLEYIYTTFLA